MGETLCLICSASFTSDCYSSAKKSCGQTKTLRMFLKPSQGSIRDKVSSGTRSKLVSIYDRALVAVFAEFAGDDLDALSDLELIKVGVGELGFQHRSFVELDHADGVGYLPFVSQGRLAQDGK